MDSLGGSKSQNSTRNKLVRYFCGGCHVQGTSATKMKTNTHTYTKLLHAPSVLAVLTLFISGALAQSSISNNYKCIPTESFFCDIKNFDTVQPFRNSLGHTTLEDARSSLHKYGFLLQIPECGKKVQLFLCSLFFPVCVVATNDMPLLLPCRNICEEARECEPQIRKAMNSSWPSDWDCNKFEYYSASHKLCVIDNQNERSIDPPVQPSVIPPPTFEPPPKNVHQTSQGPPLMPPSPPLFPQIVHDNTSFCDPGFFDCHMSDPKRPLCIEMKYVCDGKRDCRYAEMDDRNEGADEADCKEHCDEGQLYCDDKCISRHDICNGKVDCSSGIDEQDCVDNMTSVIQSVLCIFVMLSAVYILVRFFRVVRDLEDKSQSYGTSRDEENLSQQTETYAEHKVQNVITRKTYEQLLPPPIFQPQPPIPHYPRLDEPPLHDCRESFYQEPSILTTRSDAYERIIPGGYSGASSVYAFESNFEPSKTTPPAPPPTPSLERSNSPFMRSNLYENMED